MTTTTTEEIKKELSGGVDRDRAILLVSELDRRKTINEIQIQIFKSYKGSDNGHKGI